MTRTLLIFIVLSLSSVVLAQQYVPGGYAWSDCVYEVPDNSHIIENIGEQTTIELPNGDIKTILPCLYPRLRSLNNLEKDSKVSQPAVSANGWQSWTTFEAPDNDTFTQFLGYFDVPTAPKKAGLVDPIIYLFTGLQNFNWVPTPSVPTPTPPGFDIIQPVLQYGRTPNGGGKYWAVASWYVTVDDNVIASPLVKVQEGDNIFGNMTKTGNTTWFIGSLVNGKTSNIVVTKPRLFSQPYAYCTLEVYNVGECDELPTGTVHFTNLTLSTENNQVVTPSWTSSTGPDNNPCKTLAHVIADNTIDITFD